MDLPSSVAPFILRGISLVGIESVRTPIAVRSTCGTRSPSGCPRALLDEVGHEVGLAEAVGVAGKLLGSDMTGRVVVDVHR